MIFESAQSGNFRYKSKDDISEYLNSKFPDDMIKPQPQKSSEAKKSIEVKKESQSIHEENANKNLLRISKESSVKQIEIDPSPPPQIPGINNPNEEPRLSEAEIKKYVRKLYILMNLKALQVFLMFIYLSVVFLYNLPEISLVYVVMGGEVYGISFEIWKWRKDPNM